MCNYIASYMHLQFFLPDRKCVLYIQDQNIHPSLICGNINGLGSLFLATSHDATKVFVPISAVKLEEGNAASTHDYNTRLAAQKQQQQLSSHGQPSQETEYNKHVAQLQDPNRTDIQHGEGIVCSGPSLDRSQKPNNQALPSNHGNPVPGEPKRVVHHGYEPMPELPKGSQNNPVMETPSKPPLSHSYQPNHESNSSPEDENPYNLEKGSMIEFSNPPKYGVIKWIGYLSDISKKCRIAEVEMVNSISSSYS